MAGELDLKGKMDDWGPFTKQCKDTLVFSIGNPDEGHGPALSPDNDSRCANFVACKVCEKSGARFIAHIPYTTDRVGEIAKAWSPGYIPMDECVKRSVSFVKYHCTILKERGIPFNKIFVIVGHGGNNGIENYPEWAELAAEFGLDAIKFAGTIRVDIGKILMALEPFPEETRQCYLGIKGGHADTIEHSIATLYGGVDHGKLYAMNQYILERGTDAALKRWPVIGGLGGYLKFGGDFFEPLRKVPGLVECLHKFEQDKQVYVFPDFARIVMDISIATTVRDIHPIDGE